jgi:hypothetical protein
VTEAAAHGDVLVGTAAADFTKSNDWFAEYTVTIPHDGAWHLWSRQRYPSGTDQSFAFVPEGETPTFSGQQVLGNCGRNERKWHWAGQGGGSTTVPPGEPIRLSLKKGPYSFHIHPRECGASPAGNPRLDLILFVDDPAVLPNDELADNALRRAAANP